MSIRRLSLLLVVLAGCWLSGLPAVAQGTTPTEAAAIAAAKADHTAYTLAPALQAKATALHETRLLLHFGGELWGIVVLWLLLQLGIASRMRNVAINLTRNRWGQCAIFVLELLLVASVAELPLSLYAHAVSLHYGLSVQGWLSWIGDGLLSLLIEYVVGVLLVYLLFWRMRRSPRWWWLQFALLVMIFEVLGVFVTPYVIDPLFNHFEPLAKTNPALVADLERVVANGNKGIHKGIAIPPDRMFLMRASDKVTTINAYVTGFGSSKRVVVWDNSLKKGSRDEVLLIFGHEMGHYVLGHVVQGILVSFVFILVSFWIAFYVLGWLLARFGKQWRVPAQDHLGALVVLGLVLMTLNFLEEPIDNAYSRGLEHNADVYGQEVVHGIIADPQTVGQQSFQQLGQNSFDDPNVWPIDFWVDSHPPISFRAAFAKLYDPWAPGNEPKFFRK